MNDRDVSRQNKFKGEIAQTSTVKQQTFIWLNSWSLIRCQFRWNLANKVWFEVVLIASVFGDDSQVVFLLTHVVQCKQTVSFHRPTTTTTTALWQALNVTEMCFKKTTKKKKSFHGRSAVFSPSFLLCSKFAFHSISNHNKTIAKRCNQNSRAMWVDRAQNALRLKKSFNRSIKFFFIEKFFLDVDQF